MFVEDASVYVRGDPLEQVVAAGCEHVTAEHDSGWVVTVDSDQNRPGEFRGNICQERRQFRTLWLGPQEGSQFFIGVLVGVLLWGVALPNEVVVSAEDRCFGDKSLEAAAIATFAEGASSDGWDVANVSDIAACSAKDLVIVHEHRANALAGEQEQGGGLGFPEFPGAEIVFGLGHRLNEAVNKDVVTKEVFEYGANGTGLPPEIDGDINEIVLGLYETGKGKAVSQYGVSGETPLFQQEIDGFVDLGEGAGNVVFQWARHRFRGQDVAGQVDQANHYSGGSQMDSSDDTIADVQLQQHGFAPSGRVDGIFFFNDAVFEHSTGDARDRGYAYVRTFGELQAGNRLTLVKQIQHDSRVFLT